MLTTDIDSYLLMTLELDELKKLCIMPDFYSLCKHPLLVNKINTIKHEVNRVIDMLDIKNASYNFMSKYHTNREIHLKLNQPLLFMKISCLNITLCRTKTIPIRNPIFLKI